MPFQESFDKGFVKRAEELTKDASIIPAWGGGEYRTKKRLGMRGTAGYSNLLGVLPFPHVGVKMGPVGLSGPLPGIAIYSGGDMPDDYKGYDKDARRNVWQMMSKTKEEHMDAVSEQRYKNIVSFLKNEQDKHRKQKKN